VIIKLERKSPLLTTIFSFIDYLYKIQLVALTLLKPLTILVKFSHHVGKRFVADRCTHTASALTYTSLLALVPLLAIGFSIFTAFPVFRSLNDEIQDFIFTNFVPASQEMVRDYLLRFAEQASHLTAVGVGFLLVTALLLMETIDQALNDIWGVRQRRRGVSVFIVYWAVLSLGPLLVGVSLAVSLTVTSYFVSLPLISDVDQMLGVKTFLLRSMPFFLTTTAFTLIYTVVPNRPVLFRHAFVGGLLAALLFEVAKRAFAFYVTQLATYQLVYGTLSAVPIFLIWVYLSWLIILLGAEITRSFISFYWEDDKPIPCIPSNALIYAFRLIGHLWQAQRRGELLLLGDLLDLEPQLSNPNLELLLNQLQKAHWIHRLENGYYILYRSVHEVTVLELYQALSGLLLESAIKQRHSKDNWNDALEQVLLQTHQALKETLHIPLIKLYQGEPNLTPTNIQEVTHEN
jgi:membrane protein